MNNIQHEYPSSDPAYPERRGGAEGAGSVDGYRESTDGAVIEEPLSDVPEVLPPNKYTPQKEDLDLLIM